jgi:uncharacterized HAD superfamily protein
MEKRKLRIGIDLDDVVFEFVKPLLEFFNKSYSREIKFEDVNSYGFSKVFGVESKELENFIQSMITDDFQLNMNLCEFAKEVILKLSKNNDIYFITSRGCKGGTEESLNKHFSEYELIFSFNPYIKIGGELKSKICLDKKIDFMIEDSRRHALDCAEAEIKVLLLDKPWNQNFEHENVIRVKDWNEIKNKIGKMRNAV